MKITTTFFTDKPIKVQLPDTVKFLKYDVLSPFIDGDVIMKEVKSFPLSEDGTVSFNLTIPEAAATATIKVRCQHLIKQLDKIFLLMLINYAHQDHAVDTSSMVKILFDFYNTWQFFASVTRETTLATSCLLFCKQSGIIPND